MKIYNSLTRQKEDFVPVNAGKVGIYVCGITVYGPPHLGHLRTYVAFDAINEYFKHFKGYEVFYVRNITDVGSIVGDADDGEDKIELKANEEHLHPLELVDRYIKVMWDCLDAMRCERPNISPRATGHIIEIMEAVQKMIDTGYAYEVDGNVYCDIQKIKNYGELSGNTLENLSAGARLEIDENKHNPFDFLIWKKARPNSVLKWNSPWGVGYPGWHMECSIMSTKYLGETFDIHGGGRDLRFPHHENEIAQNYALYNKDPVKCWVHTGMLNASDGTKMSKSKNNYITAEEAIKEYGAVPLRWFFINGHYGSNMNLSKEVLDSSTAGLERIENFFYNLNMNVGDNYNKALNVALTNLCHRFEEEMDDDFNTPNAISAIYDFIKEANQILPSKCYNIDNIKEIYGYFTKINQVLKCFDFLEVKEPDKDVSGKIEKIESLMKERNEFRANKDFNNADKIKAKIIEMGAEIFDNKDGTSTFKLSRR